MRLLVEQEMAANSSRVFCYQAQDRAAGAGFMLGLTTEYLLSAAAKHGHGRALLVDATHGMTNLNVRPQRQRIPQQASVKCCSAEPGTSVPAPRLNPLPRPWRSFT